MRQEIAESLLRVGPEPFDSSTPVTCGCVWAEELDTKVPEQYSGVQSLICLDADGQVLFSWDHIPFGRPHMVTCDAEDNVWLSDDGGHTIYKVSPDGEILSSLGTKDTSGEDGTHFNKPTDIAFTVQGEMYVSDGYGNKRVASSTHRVPCSCSGVPRGRHPDSLRFHTPLPSTTMAKFTRA